MLKLYSVLAITWLFPLYACQQLPPLPDRISNETIASRGMNIEHIRSAENYLIGLYNTASRLRASGSPIPGPGEIGSAQVMQQLLGSR